MQRGAMVDDLDIEEDFAALRESFSSLRQSIQQELMSRADAGASAPVQRPVGQGMAPSIQPAGGEAFDDQFSILREQLLGGGGQSSAYSSRPHGSTRTTSNPPSEPLPPGQLLLSGMGFEVVPVSVERTSKMGADTVVLNAPKPGRAGVTSVVSAPARSRSQHAHNESAAEVAKQYRARAGVLRSATHDVANGLSLTHGGDYGGDGVVFGHLAMRAALDSHRRHYAAARAALRSDGSKLRSAVHTQPAVGAASPRKATEPRCPPAVAAPRPKP